MNAHTTVTLEPGGFQLAARLDDLERLFGELLAIVHDLCKVQAELAGRTTGGAR